NSQPARSIRFTLRSSPESCVALSEQLLRRSRVTGFIVKKWRSRAKVDEKRERISKWCAGGGMPACSNAGCTVVERIKFGSIFNILDIRSWAMRFTEGDAREIFRGKCCMRG